MEQDNAFMSSLMGYSFKKFDIKIKTVALYNYKSLPAKHGTKTLSTILTTLLTGLGQIWPQYLPLATLAHNTYSNTNIANYSAYELCFGRKPKLI